MKLDLALLKSKTVWVALVAIVTAIGTYITGEVTLVQMIQAIFVALSSITFRDAMRKKGELDV